MSSRVSNKHVSIVRSHPFRKSFKPKIAGPKKNLVVVSRHETTTDLTKTIKKKHIYSQILLKDRLFATFHVMHMN